MSLSKAIGVISGINEFGNLFQLVRSAVSYMRSQWNGSQEEKLKESDVLQLQSDLGHLRDTLPAMYNLIDRAEWRNHVPCVAQLLPKLKDAVYDADDLLDEFRWYELKMKIEGETTQPSPFIDFFHRVTQGSFNKVADIQKRLNNLSCHIEKMGLHNANPRFDKSLRPVTSSLRTEPKILGRDLEMQEVIRLLGVPNYSSRSCSKRKRNSNPTDSEQRTGSIAVLPIVGIGGVGKTTLAQEISTLQRVKSHFDNIIWICVSDDFDVERFTKVLIKSLSGKEATASNLDDLQRDLVKGVGKRRFLLILDDIWPDALKEGEQRWRKFCAPLTNVHQGSMMLVTTRFAEVADIVGTMDSFALEGLKDGVFWDLFKLCVFGSEDSHIDPQLEAIGRSILPKLKGTPLAAKTIGRLLRRSLDTAHWNDILNNELWKLEQKETDILPALRLSYIYLPFHLKRCFSFCAVYPKDYKFERASLAEIWVAEGFVEPQGSIPLQHIGYQYFEDLVNLSFFQKLRGAYVIHDLMHDMAQLVSKEECFIIKNASDVENVPQNVRHLSILASSDVKSSDIRSLCKHTKLQTLLCNKSLKCSTPASVIDRLFSEIQCLRVIRCASLSRLPESIGYQKHLRYLEISRACHDNILPSSFSNLYNLQFLYARKCKFERLPRGFSKLINLQKFESHTTKMEIDAAEGREQTRFINTFKQNVQELNIYNLGAISKDYAAQVELWKIESLYRLTLRWSSSKSPEHGETVLQALQPPTNIMSVHLNGYPGEYLPSWPQFGGCDGTQDMSFSELPEVTVETNNGRVGTVLSLLTEVIIEGCENLLRVEQFLQPAYVPGIRKIEIAWCKSLKSVRTEWFEYFPSLEELGIYHCPSTESQHMLAPFLKKLVLINSGNLADNIECSSLTILDLSFDGIASIDLQKWILPALQELTIRDSLSLTCIRESEPSTDLSSGRVRDSTGKFPSLAHLSIRSCERLQTLDDLLTHECIPAIESIDILNDRNLLSLPVDRFGSFSFLKKLEISWCPCLNWQSQMVLPSSLQTLRLTKCGDFSAWFPSFLENLTSLESLEMGFCEGTMSVPADLWKSNLKSLQKLRIIGCPELVSVGGPEAIADINEVHIQDCPKLKELEQPLERRRNLGV